MSSDILQQLELIVSQYRNEKLPIAVVVRLDVYSRLKELLPTVNYQKVFPLKGIGIPVLPDPAANSIAFRQTEECMLFYDYKSLTLYLKRVEDPEAWVQYCCEQAGISCQLDDAPPIIPPHLIKKK